MIAKIPKLVRAHRTINILGSIPPYVEGGTPPDPVDDYAIELISANEQYLLVGDPTELQITTDLTIQFDIWLDTAITGLTYRGVISKWDSGTIDNASYRLYFYNGDILAFVETGTGTAANYIQLTKAWTPTLDTWYRIRASFDLSARTGKIFIDGVDQSATVSPGGTGTTINNEGANLLIGCLENNAALLGFLDGRLNNVLIANTYTATHPESTTATPDDTYLTNMAGLWLMDEKVGNAIADEVNSNNAIPLPMEGPGLSTQGVTLSPVLSCGMPSALQLTGDFSLGQWVKAPHAGANIQSRAHTSYEGFLLFTQSTGKIRFYVYSANASSNNRCIKDASVAVPANEWFHLLVSFDNSTPDVKMFINGVEVSVTNISTANWLGSVNYDANQKHTIGGEWGSTVHLWKMAGHIAQVRVYDSQITSEAVARAEMEAALSTHADLVEEWVLDAETAGVYDGTNGDDATETEGTTQVDGTPADLIEVT